jgi:putative spermidine/putrescine transport system ATP-binding protein
LSEGVEHEKPGRPAASSLINADFEELRLCSVTRQYPGRFGEPFTALSNMSLVVHRGEFVTLLGPSGCGKSTALNCIGGLLRPTHGTIWLDDMRIDRVPPERRGFGMVFQTYALFPHMTVRNNVAFGLAMRGVPRVEIGRRVRAALATVHLEAQADKLPRQLSGGQQQRAAIARAIVVEPPLILMDEPLSNLDVQLRIETRSEIRRIHRELGRATIYVTHDQEEALALADRVVVLREGRVRQVGLPHEVHRSPASIDVARFMGYRNILPFEAIAAGPTNDLLVLRRGELTLTGTPREPISGANVVAAIHPDDIALGRDRTPNDIEGQVASVEYSGYESTIELVVAAGVRLHVRTRAFVAPGDRVRASIPPARVLVYVSREQR